jgi:aryl-alcohol dehydrogenase-like predicted oxidoreductase
MAVVPYNPLAGGLLTGKYTRGQEPPGHTRFGLGDWGKLYQERYWSEAAFDLIETLVSVAARNDTTPAQTALAWLLTRDGLTAPIVGATRPEQLRENLAALGSALPLELIRELDEASSRFQ